MRRGPSLRWRMILLVAGIPLLVLMPLLLYFGARYRDAHRDAYWSKGDLATIQLRQTIRTTAPFVETVPDAHGLGSHLTDIVEQVPDFLFIALVDDKGRVIEHSLPGYKGTIVEALQDLEAGAMRRGSADDPYSVVSRDLPSGRAYLIWRTMEMPGSGTPDVAPSPGEVSAAPETLYIVVGESAAVVEPALLPLVILGLAASIGVVLLVRFSLYRLVLVPLRRLAEGAAMIGAGDLAHVIRLERHDEFGFVAQAINEMARRLHDMVSRLERRVEERTVALQRRSAQLRAVSLVGQEAARERNVNALLDAAAHAISSHFGYYHTGLFILDDSRQWAILRASSSEGGRRMLDRGHRLQVGQVGIVGYVAATGKPRIAFNVGQDSVWFRNPDLPLTKSEMALPLVSDGGVVGVLDVQSDEAAAFHDDDISTLQLMADQLAVALNTARALETAEAALAELRALQVDHSRRGWARVTQRVRPLAYEFDSVATMPVSPVPVPPDLADGRVPHKVVTDGGTPLVLEALRVGGQTLGYLGLSDPQRTWSEDELALVQSVGEQVALALDNARLFEDTQRNERQQYLISTVLQVAANPELNAEQVLREIARVLAEGLDMGVAILTLPYPNLPIVRAHAMVDAGGVDVPLADRDVTLTPEHLVFLRGLAEPTMGPMPLRSGVPLRSGDTPGSESLDGWGVEAGSEDAAAAELTGDSVTRFQQVLYVPIATASARTGFIGLLQGPDAPPLDPETRELAQSLAGQIAVVLENINLSEETRRRSEELRQLYRISLELGELMGPEDVLNAIASRGAGLLGADAANLWVYDGETGELVLAYEQGGGAEGRVGYRTLPGEGLAGEAIVRHQTISIDDYTEWSGRIPGLVSARFRSMMAVPLVGRAGHSEVDVHSDGDVHSEVGPGSEAGAGREATRGHGAGRHKGEVDHGDDRSLSRASVQLEDSGNGSRGDQNWLGVLVVLSQRVGAFGEREVGLADLFAAQAVTALENARLNQDAQRRAAEFSQLYEAGIDLITVRDTKALLDRAAEWSRRVFGAERTVAFWHAEETEHFVRGQSVSDPRYLAASELDASQEGAQPSRGGFTETIMRSRQSVLVRDNRASPLPSAELLVGLGLLSQMGAPLQVGEEVLGALFVNGAAPGQFSERDLAVLEFMATQVSSALQNSIQFAQTERALSVVGRQARYQTNVSRAVALLNERGTSATQDVLRLLGEAARVPVALYFSVEADLSDQWAGIGPAPTGPVWRMGDSWADEGYAARWQANQALLRALPVDMLPYWDEVLRQRGAIVARIEDLPDGERSLLEMLAFDAALGLAVLSDTSSPGFVVLLRDGDGELWSDQEVVALQTVAAALSNTLARERLFEQVQQTLSETETLYRGSAALSEASTYQGILEVLLSYSVLGEGAQAATLQLFDRTWLGDEAPQYSEIVALKGSEGVSLRSSEVFEWGEGAAPRPGSTGRPGQRFDVQRFPVALDAMRDGTAIFVEDLTTDEVLDAKARALFRRAQGAGSVIVVPLIAGGQRIGFVHADYAAPRQFPDAARRRLVSLAQQAAIAVLNIRQLQATEARVRREQLIRQITGRIQGAPDVQGVLQTAVRELGRAFGTSRNRVQFRPVQNDGPPGTDRSIPGVDRFTDDAPPSRAAANETQGRESGSGDALRTADATPTGDALRTGDAAQMGDARSEDEPIDITEG